MPPKGEGVKDETPKEKIAVCYISLGISRFYIVFFGSIIIAACLKDSNPDAHDTNIPI